MGKSYKMPISKRFEVTAKKDFGAFKKGDKTKAGLPLILDWISKGYVDTTDEIKAATKSADAEELAESKKAEK